MLIVNDAHLCLAGRSSLEERCHSCKKPLGWGGRWYPVDSVYIAYAGRTLFS